MVNTKLTDRSEWYYRFNNPAGDFALFFSRRHQSRGMKGKMMKKLVYGVAIVSIAFCVGGLTGCQALEAVKNNVVTGIAASGLKSDIDARCKQYEEKNDGVGMKAYLDGLLKAEPK